MKSHRVRICRKLALLALLVALAGKLGAQTIFNPSFEANSFSVYPGYSAANGAIAGWTGLSDRGRAEPGRWQSLCRQRNRARGKQRGFHSNTQYNQLAGHHHQQPDRGHHLPGDLPHQFPRCDRHAHNVAGSERRDGQHLHRDADACPQRRRPLRFCVWNVHRHQHHRRPGGQQPLRHRSFTANTNARSRTGNITLLGQTIAVTQANVAVTSPSISGAEILVSGAFQMSFNSQSGVSFTVLSTTNLALPVARWSVLGAAVETPAGSGHDQPSALLPRPHPVNPETKWKPDRGRPARGEAGFRTRQNGGQIEEMVFVHPIAIIIPVGGLVWIAQILHSPPVRFSGLAHSPAVCSADHGPE